MQAAEESFEIKDLVNRIGGISLDYAPALAVAQTGNIVAFLQARHARLAYSETKVPVTVGKLYDIKNNMFVSTRCAPLSAERESLLLKRGESILATLLAYRIHGLQGILLGCHARDYEQTVATVRQLAPLKVATTGRSYHIKRMRLRSETGEEIYDTVDKLNAYAGRDWIVTFPETTSVPSNISVGSRLQVISDEEKPPVVTAALEPFFNMQKSIYNWNLLERIYGSPAAFDYSPVACTPCRVKKGGIEVELNPEQSEAVARYLSNNCPAFAVESPPGSGKTTTAAAMAASYTGDGLQLFMSTANVPVDNMVAALAALDRSKQMRIVHLVAGSREVSQSADKRSPFSCMITPEGDYMDRHHLSLLGLEAGLAGAADRKEKRKIKNKMIRARAKILKEPVTYNAIFGTVDMILSQLLKTKSCPIQRQLQTRVRRIVVDEASQMTEAALNALILNFPHAQIVLIGDSKQLPPFMYEPGQVTSELAARSALDVLKRKGNIPVIKLTHVYRAAPSLVRHYSDVFYGGSLVSCKPETKEFNLGALASAKNRCIFLQVKGKTGQKGTSKYNDSEVAALEAILADLRRAGHDHRYVIIICYYAAQVQLLQTKLDPQYKYEVHTVDSAQGREADISIVLTTRTKATTANFFTCPLRANVAMSRQKEALIVLGNESLREMVPWSKLLDKEYFSTIDYESIRASLATLH